MNVLSSNRPPKDFVECSPGCENTEKADAFLVDRPKKNPFEKDPDVARNRRAMATASENGDSSAALMSRKPRPALERDGHLLGVDYERGGRKIEYEERGPQGPI